MTNDISLCIILSGQIRLCRMKIRRKGKGTRLNKKYNSTIRACFIGYIVQAIVNNFLPLLFLTLQKSYQIPLEKITMLITFNFGLQLLVDLVSVTFIDRIGYRASIVVAHIFASSGLILLTILPGICKEPFVGILVSVLVYAVGGGLLEVLVSPIVESCPSENKEKTMSLLHSFYCWGHVGVVLLSTIFFFVVGIERWRILALIWAVIPTWNAFIFAKVPIAPLIEESETPMSFAQLFTTKVFWILLLLMFCAGASEQAISQWASTFAEKGLGVSKAVGDLAGPMLFAILMGTTRAIYGKFGEKMNLQRFMYFSGILCIASYLLIALCPNPVLGLIGCGISGASVGILWPGTFSIASATLPYGGTAMFALLALAGDLGCSGGPTYVGFISSAFGEELRRGILFAVLFPVLLLVGLYLCKKAKHKA